LWKEFEATLNRPADRFDSAGGNARVAAQLEDDEDAGDDELGTVRREHTGTSFSELAGREQQQGRGDSFISGGEESAQPRNRTPPPQPGQVNGMNAAAHYKNVENELDDFQAYNRLVRGKSFKDRIDILGGSIDKKMRDDFEKIKEKLLKANQGMFAGDGNGAEAVASAAWRSGHRISEDDVVYNRQLMKERSSKGLGRQPQDDDGAERKENDASVSLHSPNNTYKKLFARIIESTEKKNLRDIPAGINRLDGLPGPDASADVGDYLRGNRSGTAGKENGGRDISPQREELLSNGEIGDSVEKQLSLASEFLRQTLKSQKDPRTKLGSNGKSDELEYSLDNETRRYLTGMLRDTGTGFPPQQKATHAEGFSIKEPALKQSHVNYLTLQTKAVELLRDREFAHAEELLEELESIVLDERNQVPYVHRVYAMYLRCDCAMKCSQIGLLSNVGAKTIQMLFEHQRAM
jgi:hypothetical protein